jgi:two-component system, LytTR family, sensor kinase
MKRILLHISFWVVYLSQDAMLEYLVVRPVLNDYSEHDSIFMAVLAALTIMIVKMLYTYFILYVVLKDFFRSRAGLVRNILLVAAALFITLVLYRLVFNDIIYPFVYHGTIKTPPFFDMRRILYAVMDIGFVSGGAIAIKLLRTQLVTKEKEKSLVREKLETELKFLRNQTNPHFLFNTLNNIYALARKKSDDTASVVMKLSQLLRFMLYESGKARIPIFEEIKMVEGYLELERLRYNQRLSISFHKQLDDPTKPIAPLLLLPFIENAFKHGISESRFDSFIHIRLTLKEGLLTFNIENSKESATAEIVTDNIGLSNVRRQLELMYRDYKIDVRNEPSVFKVDLSIKLDSHGTL